jgi:two-component system sensor histidine kinase KdpD
VAQSATVQMESERLRNSLLSALSHDLRTPLAALVGLSEMLAASLPRLSPQQLEMARALSDKSQRMADMVTNLLDMARIQSGEVRLRLDWQSMEEIVGTAVKQTQGALGRRPLGIQLDPAVALVECDAVLIERVLVNLLENAGKYTPELSPVEILVRAVDDELLVSVRDHGPGVARGQEELIFEKFTRGDAESATPGVGLGLAICRAIVLAHRGRIRVEPTHPHGATFTFTLPLGVPPVVDGCGDGPGDVLPVQA